jgi:tetratricopeptide (TPR) repeat protein
MLSSSQSISESAASKDDISQPGSRPVRRSSLLNTGFYLLFLCTSSWLIAGQICSLIARRYASEGRLSRAMSLIPWCQRLCPWDTSLDWLAAKCARRVNDRTAWTGAIAKWNSRSPGSKELKVERELMQIQSGILSADAQGQLKRFILSDIDRSDIAEAFVLGFIAQQDLEQAHLTLSWWEGLNIRMNDATLYRGVLARLRGERDLARSHCDSILLKSPHHELALIHLADLSLETESADIALGHFTKALREVPSSVRAIAGTARCLRKLGRWTAARRLLKRELERSDPENDILLENGEIALELGNYSFAEECLKSAVATRTPVHNEAMAIATAYSLSGHPANGQPLLRRDARIESLQKAQRDLQVDNILEPENARVRQQLQEINDEQRRMKS